MLNVLCIIFYNSSSGGEETTKNIFAKMQVFEAFRIELSTHPKLTHPAQMFAR